MQNFEVKTDSLQVVSRRNGDFLVFRVLIPHPSDIAAIDVQVRKTSDTDPKGNGRISLVPSQGMLEQKDAEGFKRDIEDNNIPNPIQARCHYMPDDTTLQRLAGGLHVPVVEVADRSQLADQVAEVLPKVQQAYNLPDSVIAAVQTVIGHVNDGLPEKEGQAQQLVFERLAKEIVTVTSHEEAEMPGNAPPEKVRDRIAARRAGRRGRSSAGGED